MEREPGQNLFDLTDKVCLITGGAGLLGKAFSTACAGAGGTVIVLDIDEAGGREVVGEIRRTTDNSQVFFYQCDMTRPDEVQRTIQAIVKDHKKIDALVNNAYPKNKNYGKKFEAVAYEDFCENLSRHVGGYFLMSKTVAEIMKPERSGTIVNLGSIYGFAAPRFAIYEGTDMTSPVEYAAIKGAILNLTTYLASYLGQHGIRVNAISPGGVSNKQPESFVEKYSQKVVLGKRMATPDDIVGALVFLLSDASAYMTGQNLVVDGGWTL